MSSKCDECDAGVNDEKCDSIPVEVCYSKPTRLINAEPHLLYDDSKNFTINFFTKCRISIYKPLIPLKLSLFLYYGGGSYMLSFLTLLYKQRGVSLSQLSVMSIVTPVFQVLGTIFMGVTSDRLGRTKSVLLINHLLLLSAVTGVLFMPAMETATEAHLECHFNGSSTLKASRAIGKDAIRVHSCSGHCPGKLTVPSLVVRVNHTSTRKMNDSYVMSVNAWCSDGSFDDHCALSCSTQPDSVAGWKLWTYSVLFVLILTTFSNGYRFQDVACMTLVEAHCSTFGRERMFAMIGQVLASPLAGFLADASAPIGSKRNLLAPLYLFLGSNLLLLPILCVLPVHNRTPARHMWRKTATFMSRPDNLVFLAMVIVLGTAWNFRKLFLYWHLESLGSNSLLMGLVTSSSALYGLPFLFTSHWWVAKIGTSGVFIAALLAYAANAAGYAILRDPWVSLGLEVTDTMSYYLLWVAVVQHSHWVAPTGLTATVIATTGAIHFSAAKVTAGLLGRFIMNRFGSRAAFGCCAFLSVATALLYAAYLCARNRSHSTAKSVSSLECQALNTIHETSINDNYSKEMPDQLLEHPEAQELGSLRTLNIYQQSSVQDQYFLDHCKESTNSV